jgi:hypothetical protein
MFKGVINFFKSDDELDLLDYQLCHTFIKFFCVKIQV